LKTWVEKLITEYGDAKQKLEGYKLKLDPLNPLQQEELNTVSGMIADMNYALEWLSSGRRPWTRRGIDSRDAYRRAALMDMDLFPAVDFEPDEVEITHERKRQLVNVLLKMSKRERQCYLLHMAQGLSLAEIAKELNVSKASIQTHINRARGKVQQGLTG
jgi:RNA polymerase sigma factor (sigma-70 family)